MFPTAGDTASGCSRLAGTAPPSFSNSFRSPDGRHGIRKKLFAVPRVAKKLGQGVADAMNAAQVHSIPVVPRGTGANKSGLDEFGEARDPILLRLYDPRQPQIAQQRRPQALLCAG